MNNPFEALEKRLSVIEDHVAEIRKIISNLTPQQQQDTVGISEVAKMLNISISTVYTKTHNKTIPFSKQGKKLLFSRKRIQEFIDSGEVKTLDQTFKDSEHLIEKKIRDKEAA